MAFLLFLISLIVYGMTVAPTTSYWDCGEFITSSYILGVPHPPGSPIYVLIGRLFTMLPFPEDIGLRVNLISVIVSALTVMFTYLVIVRLLREWRGIPETVEQKVVIYTSGVIGALAFAFSDSFWFNAVEAEVYAFSMFFTAIVVWLILVWVEKADQHEPAADRILLLIAYLIGLATGVHLLNIMALPTVFLIIYFKKFDFNLTTFGLFMVVSLLGFMSIYNPFFDLSIVDGIPWVLKNFSFAGVAVLVVALFIGVYYAITNQKRILSLVLLAILLITVGYSTYTALYIRSNLQPAINENNPNVPARFVSYLKREQYGDIPITERRAPMWEYQIKKMYIRYFGWQFIGKGTTFGADGYILETLSTKGLMGLPFLVGLIGMFYHFNRDWKRAFSILALFIATGVLITVYLNQEDPQPRERDYAYVGSFFAFALWIGLGATAMLELIAGSFRRSAALKKVGIGLTIVLLLFAVPIKMFGFNFHQHDRTGNYVAYDYSFNILQSCDPDAILFTNGDNDTFPLWFLQYVYGIRKDVRVVNLSLLNTPWYIKQLRDEEPKVPISLADEQIDRLEPNILPVSKNVSSFRITAQTLLDLRAIGMPVDVLNQLEGLRNQKLPAATVLAKLKETIGNKNADRFKSVILQYAAKTVRLKMKVPKETVLDYLAKGEDNTSITADAVTENPEVVFEVEGTLLDGRAMRVQDRMIDEILRANKFRKPIYFAVTVSPQNMLGLDNRRNKELPNHLRMDGLAFQIMPYGGPDEFISPQKLEKNLFEKFQFRNLDNPDVFLNDNIKGLLQNYRSAFLRLTNYYQSLSATDPTMSERALGVLDRMNQVMPEDVLPFRDARFSLSFGRMYAEAGRPDELEKRIVQARKIYQLRPEDELYLVQLYSHYVKNDAKAESLALSLLEDRPEQPSRYIYGWLLGFYVENKQYDKGIELLQKWLDLNPDDIQAQKQLAEFQAFATLEDSLQTVNDPSDSTQEKPE